MFDVEISNNTITDLEAETIKKNIMFFCNTPKGSLPQMRGYGLDFSIIEEPYHIFRMKATVDIISGIRKYYGVQIDTINITADENGKIKIEISI